MKVLELFSGIGGMHWALLKSCVDGEVVTAVDINTVANNVYKHNFGGTKLSEKNIQSLTSQIINKMEIETILMSPPCQPFTRVGLKKDVSDNRSSAFTHIVSILPELSKSLKYILMENVRGFETSEARHLLIETLGKNYFNYQEFLISPTQFGVPNSRERYYLIAKRKPLRFIFVQQNSPMTSMPKLNGPSGKHLNTTSEFKCIKNILEYDDYQLDNYKKFLVPEKELSRAMIFDIVNKESDRSCCFTKAYTHYVDGTGSVYCPFESNVIGRVFEMLKSKATIRNSPEYIEAVKALHLRYFTPREILRLMCFPEDFSFPDSTSDKQKYRLLGNSINVFVVSELIKLMCLGDI